MTSEIDVVLLASVDGRRQAKDPVQVVPSLTDSNPTLPVLTKDDRLRFFRTHGHPAPGALLGVYRWATDLGMTHFNFEFDFDRDDLSLLDAYDRFPFGKGVGCGSVASLRVSHSGSPLPMRCSCPLSLSMRHSGYGLCLSLRWAVLFGDWLWPARSSYFLAPGCFFLFPLFAFIVI